MSHPIRVLQLGKHFDPDTGGIETATLNLSETLLAHDIRADVLCIEAKGPYPAAERGYRVIRCHADLAVGSKRLSLSYVWEGRRLERDYDCAIVHLPNPLGALAALGWRKPVIILWHADIPQAPVRWATAPLDRALLKKAAAVIGPTSVHLDESHHASAMTGRREIIRLPFDRSLIPVATGEGAFADKLSAFRHGRMLSISVGRLVSYKGFDVLIEAARHFGDRLCALIVGTGPIEQDLRQRIIAAGVEDRVLMAGALSAQELANGFAQARLGCMPSVTAAEMYGIAQIEAMAAGLPVVSTDIPRSGVPLINRNEETGLVVPPGDARALAAAMRRLVDDEALWKRLSDGALRAVLLEHDCAMVGTRYAGLIRDITDLS